jgi:hypothetical protein
MNRVTTRYSVQTPSFRRYVPELYVYKEWVTWPKAPLISLTFSKKMLGQYLKYDSISKTFRTESITKYTLTTINTRWKQHKVLWRQIHFVAKSCTTCSSPSRWPVRKLLDTHSYVLISSFSALPYSQFHHHHHHHIVSRYITYRVYSA